MLTLIIIDPVNYNLKFVVASEHIRVRAEHLRYPFLWNEWISWLGPPQSDI